MVLTLAAMLAGNSVAAAPDAKTAVPNVPDMRLWSFGDCANRFPYVDSAEHKECVRVVGSPEAKDARAHKLCAATYAGNATEVDNCKAAYDANKARLAQANSHPDAAAAPVDADTMRKVRAITTAAVEHDRVRVEPAAVPAASEAAPAPAEVDASFWSPATVLGFGVAFMLVLGVGSMVARRKQSGTYQRG